MAVETLLDAFMQRVVLVAVAVAVSVGVGVVMLA
jgi:hypothetical protein